MHDEFYAKESTALDQIGGAVMERPVSYIERVDREIAALERRLIEQKRMKEILTAHPEFEELLTLVGRNRF